MKVCILGCGPAGLMAAHAAAQLGHEPLIYSRKVKSEMFGAMYLHRGIPDLNNWLPDFTMHIMKAGTASEYAQKVYGDPYAPCSFDTFETGDVPAWDLRATYDQLWEKYNGNITHMDVTIEKARLAQDAFPLVISSIPAYALCDNPAHGFREQKIWVSHGEDVRILGPDYIMYYMGDPTVDWYRFSRIHHYSAWEYAKDPGNGYGLSKFKLDTGTKPISTNCNCLPGILRVGRFGKWTKGVLTHHAYKEAHDALFKM